MGDDAMRRAAHAALDAFFDALTHGEGASDIVRPVAPPQPPAPPRRKGLRAVPNEPVSDTDQAVARAAMKRRGMVPR